MAREFEEAQNQERRREWQFQAEQRWGPQNEPPPPQNPAANVEPLPPSYHEVRNYVSLRFSLGMVLLRESSNCTSWLW